MSRNVDAWITDRRSGAVQSLRRAVSATGLTHHRAGFGWTVRPAPGSVLASARRASWDPEPDYFHHWVRDAAVVMRVLPDIVAHATADQAAWWRAAFTDHVAFSLAISDPNAAPLQSNPLRATTDRDHRKFLRPDAELQALTGISLLAEPRCAADGSSDLERWSRPQDDGPALRAVTVMAVTGALPELASDHTAQLIHRDLAYTAQVAGRACIGPWEEEPARHHSYTLIAQWDALDRGADWLEAQGADQQDGDLMRAKAASVLRTLETTAETPPTFAWKDAAGAPPGGYDSATVLAILHAGRNSGPLARTAPHSLGTIAALEAQFRTLYPLNATYPVPAMGRSVGDAFFGGNPWLPITLGFAELHYDIAAQTRDKAAFDKAEAWMDLLHQLLPDGDALPEQIDRATGAPVSCLELSWSAAAFIGAAAARARAAQVMASGER